jgi:hypothetical protein
VIHVYDRELNKSRKDKPERVAYEVDLYRLDPGDPPHAMEEALATAEGAMIKALQQLEQDQSAPTIPQAEAVVSFVALQYVRNPDVLQEFNRFSVDATKLKLEMIARNPQLYEARCRRLLERDPALKREDLPTAEDILESLRGGEFEIRMNNGFVVASVLKTQDTVFRAIADMELRFYRVGPGQELVTGDRPVVLVSTAEAPAWGGLGVATAEAIVMPLGPKLLFMARPDLPFKIKQLAAHPSLVTEVNRWVSHQSRWTFSRAAFDFDPTPLNDPAGSRRQP